MTSDQKRRTRSRRLAVLAGLLIVAIPLVVFAWGRGSSAFAIERIRLSGARRVSAAAATKTLRAHFLGHNLFTVHASDVAAALRAFPYVDDVRIDRDFPGTLRVHILEYRPAAVLFSTGRWYVVSREGRVLLRLPGEVPSPSPGATGAAAERATGESGTSSDGASSQAAPSAGPREVSASPEAAASSAAAAEGAEAAAALSSSSLAASSRAPSLFTGDLTAATLSAVTLPRQAARLPILLTSSRARVRTTVADRSVEDALAILAALPRELRTQVRFVSVDPAGILAVLRNGVTFAFGDAHDLHNKVLALQAVLSAYRRHHLHATWVDVSVPNRPLGTPVIASHPGPMQTSRPTSKARPSASASPVRSLAATASSDATDGASPAVRAATASASPAHPSSTATPRPPASPRPRPTATRSAGGAAG
jgi:hypothetical protein